VELNCFAEDQYCVDVNVSHCAQAEKAGGRLKQLKAKVEEAEEEMARATAQKRKLQRDADEQTEQLESTQRELDQLRARLRGTAGASADKSRYVTSRLRIRRVYTVVSGYGLVGAEDAAAVARDAA